MRIGFVFLVLGWAAQVSAQNTCYTDPQGTTLCSTPEAVVRGSTDSTGNSVYRDDRGNLLDFQTDQTGKASVELPSGKSINWSQGVLGEKKYPFNDRSRIQAVPLVLPSSPGSVPGTLPKTSSGQP